MTKTLKARIARARRIAARIALLAALLAVATVAGREIVPPAAALKPEPKTTLAQSAGYQKR